MEQDETVGPGNIGNPVEFTIKQLAELCIELTGSESKIIYMAAPSDDPKQRQPDITKARKHLKWEPNVKLRDGLVKTIDYFANLDLSKYKDPTSHTAHKNSDELAKAK